MGKDPAFLFYTSDFLMGTMLLSFEDRGKYITLLSYMHQSGRATEETVKSLVGDTSAKLKIKFKIDTKGLWYNERLEQEIARRKKFSTRCRGNGKLGGRPPLGNPKIISLESQGNEKYPFEKFWKMYDKPTEKISCALKWVKLTENEKEQIFQRLPAYVTATPERQFRKNPLTYLNRKAWMDEILPEPHKPVKKSAIEILVETGKYE